MPVINTAHNIHYNSINVERLCDNRDFDEHRFRCEVAISLSVYRAAIKQDTFIGLPIDLCYAITV